MSVYESETITRKRLEELRKRNKCAVCGEWLAMFLDPESHKAFIACHRWQDTHHEGIAKEFEYKELNINSRRLEMSEQQGVTKTKALDKYIGRTALSRAQAMEIMETIWPDAPTQDKLAAAILCSSYGLNPLANHVFLLPFKDKDTGEATWARVWGIKAKRLLASRKGGFSYLDMSPRIMTDDEAIKVWGAVDQDNLCYLTHLKDMKTGAEVYGYGKWQKNKIPFGVDKGNTKANMASIRSESQALDRLRPAEMPTGFAVTDEEYIEGESRVIDITTGEITELPPEPGVSSSVPDISKSGLVEAGSSGIAPLDEKPTKTKRDLGTIKNIEQLAKALKEDFGLSYQQQWNELNIKSWTELTISPAQAYSEVAATRT